MYAVNLTRSYFPAQSDTPFEATTVADILARRRREQAGSLALVEITPEGERGRSWTYDALSTDAERLARALSTRYARGARIAVFANNHPEWILLELACALAGLTLVTVNPAYTPRELAYVLGQSRSEGVFFAPEVRGRALAPVVAEAARDLPAIREQIDLADHAAVFAGADAGALRETTPDDVIQIQYTSGTTGFPKGALLHQKGLIQNAVDTMRRARVRKGDVILHNMPLFHTTGCAIIALGGLTIGGALLLTRDFDPAVIISTIDREKPRFLLGVPTMIIAILDAARETTADLSSIEAIMSGGAMVAPELVRRTQGIFGAPIQIIYGQTECSPVIAAAWPDDCEDDLCGTIGQPLPHMDVAILDPQTNDVCPVGAQGEICTRGYHVMTGYNDNPEATRAAIDENGWLHTGDLGRMDARGYLRITGRVKEMIIRGGENLFPAEIENAMLEHPAINEAAVVGVPDETWGEQVACFMRASNPAVRPDPALLKTFIRERLSPQKTPTYWIWVEDWPMTGSGKIKKFALREAFVRGDFEALTA